MTGAIPKYPYPSKVYQPLDKCLYCDETENLSKEHIIPLGFGSELIVPKASCKTHTAATGKVEDFVLRKYLCALRSHLGLPSRNPLHRPDGYMLKLSRGGHSWKQKVKLADHPGLVRFMMFVDPPGRVLGRERQQKTWSVRFIDAKIFPDIDMRVARLGADSFEDKITINGMSIARMIAKIGHAFAIAELGFDAFEELYVAHLIGADAQDWNYWVGG